MTKNCNKRIPIEDFASYDGSNPALVTVAVPVAHGEKPDPFIKELADDMFVSGWNFSYSNYITSVSVSSNTDEMVDIYLVVFEKKYHSIDASIPEVLYHVSPQRYIGKIFKNGLVPHSKAFSYSYPERVYFFRSRSIELMKRYGLTKVNHLRQMEPSEHVDDNGFVVVKVFKSSIEKYNETHKGAEIRFFADPCFDGAATNGLANSPAIFTYSPIPPYMIENSGYYYVMSSDSSEIIVGGKTNFA